VVVNAILMFKSSIYFIYYNFQTSKLKRQQNVDWLHDF